MTLTEKPQNIKNAVILICISLVVGLFKVVLDYDFLLSLGPIQGTAITMALTIFIMLFLAYKIWQGRNWSRITFSVLFILGIYPAVLLMPAEAERSIAVMLGSALQTLAQVAALILMYLPVSNGWFKSIKAANNA
jgi:hypothetical protein